MPLSPAESRIQSALGRYLDMVGQAGKAASHPAWIEKLKISMVTLEEIESELAPQLDPRLRHFLESKSYRKAHDHLSALTSSRLANPAAPRQTGSP